MSFGKLNSDRQVYVPLAKRYLKKKALAKLRLNSDMKNKKSGIS
jgi:hypothetical protein